jgi:hypothetical protein
MKLDKKEDTLCKTGKVHRMRHGPIRACAEVLGFGAGRPEPNDDGD